MGDNGIVGETIDGLLSIFEQNYNGYYALEGATHPDTGENLFVATYANGKGADVIPQSEIPLDVTANADWGGYVSEANAMFAGEVSAGIVEILSAVRSSDMRFDPELAEILNSGNLDILTTSYLDVFYADEAAERIQRIVGGDNPELYDRMQSIRNDLNAIMESPEYSALIKVNHGLSDLGMSPEQVNGFTTDPDFTVLDLQNDANLAPAVPVNNVVIPT